MALLMIFGKVEDFMTALPSFNKIGMASFELSIT